MCVSCVCISCFYFVYVHMCTVYRLFVCMRVPTLYVVHTHGEVKGHPAAPFPRYREDNYTSELCAPQPAYQIPLLCVQQVSLASQWTAVKSLPMMHRGPVVWRQYWGPM